VYLLHGDVGAGKSAFRCARCCPRAAWRSGRRGAGAGGCSRPCIMACSSQPTPPHRPGPALAAARSRAFIRAAAEDPDLTVPSPTFLLQLVYEEQEGRWPRALCLRAQPNARAVAPCQPWLRRDGRAAVDARWSPPRRPVLLQPTPWQAWSHGCPPRPPLQARPSTTWTSIA
jgi:hypothetical protein